MHVLLDICIIDFNTGRDRVLMKLEIIATFGDIVTDTLDTILTIKMKGQYHVLSPSYMSDALMHACNHHSNLEEYASFSSFHPWRISGTERPMASQVALLFSCSIVPDSLQHSGLQSLARLPCSSHSSPEFA